MLAQKPLPPVSLPTPTVAPARMIRYAVCGLSIRSIHHFVLPLLGQSTLPDDDYSANAEIVGILDLDEERVATFNRKYGVEIPWFSAEQGVEAMIRESQPDVLLVAGPDFTHCEHILAGLRHHLRVIVEKPMVTNCEETRRVLDAERQSRGTLVVTHNYRYASISRHIKRLLMQGKAGKITNVELVYNLDTQHGSSFFYRWNRERANSGGLSIHKAVHHFDLMSWLVASEPESVFAFGALNYFGKEGALRPRDAEGHPLSAEETRKRCPYFLRHHAPKGAAATGRLKPAWDRLDLPYNAQYTGSSYIYDDVIDIEDTYAAVIRYRNGVFLSYSSNYSTPWKGFTLAINGTGGRLEISHHTDPSLPAHGSPGQNPVQDKITFYPLFGGKEEYIFPKEDGAHGGGDPLIRKDLFIAVGQESRELGLISTSYDGALGIATGEAIWRSAKEGRPYAISDLLGCHSRRQDLPCDPSTPTPKPYPSPSHA